VPHGTRLYLALAIADHGTEKDQKKRELIGYSHDLDPRHNVTSYFDRKYCCAQSAAYSRKEELRTGGLTTLMTGLNWHHKLRSCSSVTTRSGDIKQHCISSQWVNKRKRAAWREYGRELSIMRAWLASSVNAMMCCWRRLIAAMRCKCRLLIRRHADASNPWDARRVGLFDNLSATECPPLVECVTDGVFRI